MTARLSVAMLLAVLMTGCDDYPKDVAETTRHVQQSGTLRTGVIAGGDSARPGYRELVATVARAAGADPRYETGSAEDLLPRLEQGEIDLVVGRFAKSSPWTRRAAFSAPYRAKDPPDNEPVLRALVRKGENRWLMLVARAVDGGGQ